MADYTFSTPSGQTIARETLIAYLNTGSSTSATWSPLGARTEESSVEYDWNKETVKDILGKTYGTMRKPILTQTFDPAKITNGDAALKKIWDLAVVAQDAQGLANLDMLIVHLYTTDGDTTAPASFAERYSACMAAPTGLGGPGGGDINMPIEVTFGGDRTLGTATVSSAGVVTFTADT